MKNKQFIGIVALSVAIIITVSATVNYFWADVDTNVAAKPLAVDTYATNESVSLLANIMNNFSLDMYKQLSTESEGNIFFSPYSIFVALAMTYEGARNETAREMYDVLHLPQNNETMLCSFGKIYNLLNQKQEYILGTANALWILENYPFLQSYLTFIENYYMGKATEVDFSHPEEAAHLINGWVEENTHGKIQDLLSSSDIDPMTALILTNAIYFKGTWVIPFNPEKTAPHDFMVSPSQVVQAPMMSHSDRDTLFNYSETTNMQILELPYAGKTLSMLLLLPKDIDITSLEKSVDYQNLSLWRQSFTKEHVEVQVPKFTLETEYKLKDTLKAMGMKIPFTENADFSGMTGRRDLFIDKVIHKAFVEINEEGTEAAAATSVHIALTAIPDMITFNANHPFIFVIQHRETGNILFMGRVTNPLGT